MAGTTITGQEGPTLKLRVNNETETSDHMPQGGALALSALLDYLTSMGYDPSMTKRRAQKVTDQIRQAIDDSQLTRYRISRDTGIDQSQLAKFFHGTRGLSLENLDRLCAYLELEIVKTDKGKGR